MAARIGVAVLWAVIVTPPFYVLWQNLRYGEVSNDSQTYYETEVTSDDSQRTPDQYLPARQIFDPDRFTDLSDADDAGPRPKNGLIAGLANMIDASDLLSDQPELRTTLEEADEVLSRVKRENREALRRANRQIRIRGMDTPNVILIVADTLGFGDLGCYGQTKILTPNIDQLAALGVRFTNYYAGGSRPDVSQWAMITGKFAAMQTRGGRLVLHSADTPLPETMWRSGYTTSLIGDCNLAGTDDPRRLGFDHWFGYRDGKDAADRYPEFLWRNGSRVRIVDNADGQSRQDAHGLLMSEVYSHLKNRRGGSPFFVQISYSMPASPVDDITELLYLDEGWTRDQIDYAAMVTRLDQDLAELIERLNEYGLAGNTAVILTSHCHPHATHADAARFFGSTGSLRYEDGGLYEGSLRAPLIVCAPSYLPAGTVCDAVSGAWDLMPTIAELIESSRTPSNIDGDSLVPMINGRSLTMPRMVYWESFDGQLLQAARLDRWKWIRDSSGQVELYDLKNDPHETSNIIGQHPQIAAQIERLISDAAQAD